MNKIKLLSVFVALFLFPQMAFAQPKTYSIDPAKSSVQFSFKSTLHAVEGSVGQYEGTFSMDPGASVLIPGGQIEFSVLSMDTQEPKRDRNMRTMLDAERFSKIEFVIDQGTLTDKEKGVIKGRLKIREVEQALEVPVTIIQSKEGYVIAGETTLSLKSFALKPPSVAMVIRVFDPVKIKFAFSLNLKEK